MARKAGYCWHVHPFRLMELCYDIDGAIAIIKKSAPLKERELHLRLFQPVKAQLPVGLVKAWVAYRKAWAVFDKIGIAYGEAKAVLDKAKVACDEIGFAYNKARDASDEAWVTCIRALEFYKEEIERLHAIECPDCTWDGETIFAKEVKGVGQMRCPVCGKELVARITKPGKAGRSGVYFTCPEDSRHIRGFVNDPAFVRAAQSVDHPAILLGGSQVEA